MKPCICGKICKTFFLITSSVCTSLLPEVAREWQSPPVTCSVTQETTAPYCQPTPGPSPITCNTIPDLIKLSCFLLGLNFVIHNSRENRIFQLFSSFTISGETFGKQWIYFQVLCIPSPSPQIFLQMPPSVFLIYENFFVLICRSYAVRYT